MFERFTERSLRVILLSQEEARRSGHNFVGTEQLLLGLIGEGTSTGSEALKEAGVKIGPARKEVERMIGKGAGFAAVEIPFTPRAKNILEQALYKARSYNHGYIGTEHILLALLDDKEGVAVKILSNLKVDIRKIRNFVFKEMGEVADLNEMIRKKKEEELNAKLKKLREEEKKREIRRKAYAKLTATTMKNFHQRLGKNDPVEKEIGDKLQHIFELAEKERLSKIEKKEIEEKESKSMFKNAPVIFKKSITEMEEITCQMNNWDLVIRLDIIEQKRDRVINEKNRSKTPSSREKLYFNEQLWKKLSTENFWKNLESKKNRSLVEEKKFDENYISSLIGSKVLKEEEFEKDSRFELLRRNLIENLQSDDDGYFSYYCVSKTYMRCYEDDEEWEFTEVQGKKKESENKRENKYKFNLGYDDSEENEKTLTSENIYKDENNKFRNYSISDKDDNHNYTNTFSQIIKFDANEKDEQEYYDDEEYKYDYSYPENELYNYDEENKYNLDYNYNIQFNKQYLKSKLTKQNKILKKLDLLKYRFSSFENKKELGEELEQEKAKLEYQRELEQIELADQLEQEKAKLEYQRELEEAEFNHRLEVELGIAPADSEFSKPIESGKETMYDEKSKKRHSPTVREFTTNLSMLAALGSIDPVIGRDKEVARVIQILSRRRKNNPILIGEPGVGKTAIAEGLALKIYKQEVVTSLASKEVLVLDMSLLLAGTKYRGEFEERLKRIMDEIKNDDSLILVIDEVHTLVGAGAAEGALDAANILKPALARGELQCIGATTLSEYRQIEKDPALERRFQPVFVAEPTKQECFEILKGLRMTYENFHHVRIDDLILRLSVDMSVTYLKDRFLPDKAIDLLDEAGSHVKIAYLSPANSVTALLEEELLTILDEKDCEIRSHNFEAAAYLRDKEMEIRTQIRAFFMQELDEKEKELAYFTRDELPPVTVDDINKVISAWTGVPLTKLEKEERKKILNMEKEMHKRVIGQNKAVTAICAAVKRSRIGGIKNPNRPIASFLFCGPTGVGKTELTKALADYFFGSEDAMIRFDMSEYMEKHTVAKLIGSPPGYVGYNEGGQLTEAVRRKPFCLILFDEVEKAHPDIFNILLQVLDDGRLTDSKGRRVDFTSTIIIMTSNLGSQHITGAKFQKQEKNDEQSALKLGSEIETTKSLPSKTKRNKLAKANLEKQNSNSDDLGKDLMTWASVIKEREKTAQNEEEYKMIEKLVKNEIKNFFRPEFINRIDDIIVFEKLKKTEIKEILKILLKQLSKRLLESNTILEVSEEAQDYIVEIGYDPIYGARPLRRAMTNLIEDSVSNQLLEIEVSTLRRLLFIEFDKVRKIRVYLYPIPSFVISPYNKDITMSAENAIALQSYINSVRRLKKNGANLAELFAPYYYIDEVTNEKVETEQNTMEMAKETFIFENKDNLNTGSDSKIDLQKVSKELLGI